MKISLYRSHIFFGVRNEIFTLRGGINSTTEVPIPHSYSSIIKQIVSIAAPHSQSQDFHFNPKYKYYLKSCTK